MENHNPGYHILLIDDDEDDYLLIRDMLASLDRSRFTYQWAKNYDEASRSLASKNWDAVLIDYDLGAVTGTQIIRETLANGKKVPFIMVTGRGNYEKDVEAMQAGAVDYISKSDLSPALLERAVRYAIERQRVEAELEQRVEARTEELQITIEELQVAEEELHAQLESLIELQNGGEDQASHFQTLFEFAPSGYLVTDKAGKILEMNQTAERLLRGARAQLVGKPLSVYIVQQDRFDFRNKINQLIQKKPNQEWNFRVQPRKHPPFDGQFIASPIWDTRGNVIAIRWLINDVTQQAQAHRDLQKAKDELETGIARRNMELSEANERLQNEMAERQKASEKLKVNSLELERLNQDLKNFFSIASHDLNEPLRKIQQFGANLRAVSGPVLDEKGLDQLERMLMATARMQEMLNDLFVYSRIITHTQPFARIDLSQEIQKVISDLEDLLERTQGIIHLGELPAIEADPVQIRHLFQNLIQNALKFHQPGVTPVVSITAQFPSPDEVQLLFKDNGIGLDEENGERIFQPFQRLHGRGEYEGNGMGLAICRRIVERHFGTISVNSCPGLGSTFIVTLPIHQPVDG